MIFQEEFQRFESPLIHVITFKDDGTILSANLWSEELSQQYPDGISLSLPMEDYWQGRVNDWLNEHYNKMRDRDLWDASKVSNE